MSKQELNWTLVKYTFEGDHKVYINTYEGTEQECRSYAKNLTDGRLCLLDPQQREWEL
jgi:hypothetical protein